MALAKSTLAAFVAFSSAFTALAAALYLHGFGREVWRSKPSEAHVIHLKAPPTLRIVIGGESLELERTTLPDLVKRFGGAIHSRGDAGDSIYWVCYYDAPTRRTLWFVSDEMGGSDRPSWRSRLVPTAAVIRMAALGLRCRSRM
jgi:hypothetical protein